MSRSDADRLADILDAIAAIRAHVQRGPITDPLVNDAVRIRLLEIGEAVKALSDAAISGEPSIPWRQIGRMRDHLAHRYFATVPEVIQSTIDNDLQPLEDAVRRIQEATLGEP